MSHILGIGVDIVEVKRFKQFETDREHSFLRRVFTPSELEYCFSQARPAEHLAGRFAAKEAVIKALAGVLDGVIAYNEIEIGRSAKGSPMADVARIKSRALGVQISISHTSEIAIAFVVITDYE